MENETSKPLDIIRAFAIEITIYGIMLAIYWWLVFRLLENFLAELFLNHLVLYSVAALGLLIFQGIVLDIMTTFLIRLLRLDKFE